jgi:hypothetical protein
VSLIVSLKLLLYFFPQFRRYNPYVFAGIDLPSMCDLTQVNGVLKDFVKRTTRIGMTSPIFYTSVNERVYITAWYCKTGFVRKAGL